MSFKKDLRLLVKPYYLINILLSVSYIIAKRLPVICNYIFAQDGCEFDGVSDANLSAILTKVILTCHTFQIMFIHFFVMFTLYYMSCTTRILFHVDNI